MDTLTLGVGHRYHAILFHLPTRRVYCRLSMTARRRLLLLFVALLVVASAVVWWLGSGKPSYRGANVLLVTIDTLRADHLGAYGDAGAETPTLDRLAAEGIRFDQAISPVPLTLPSHTSIMTSLNPPEHGVRDNGAAPLPAGVPTLASVLSRAGYASGAFVGAYVLHSRWGLNAGFETYDDRFDYDDPLAAPGQVERRGAAVVAAALDWLHGDPGSPFFAWVHLYDPHAPYAAPEPYGSRLAERPYDGEIAYADALVGQLLEALRVSGELKRTLVVVTSDHGEGLGDHGEPGHGLFLYDATQRVPLLMRLPDRRAAGRVVEEQVRLIDIAPTILELLELPPEPGFHGGSLVPFFRGSAPSRPAYAETIFPRTHFGWQELYALRDEGHKYILAPRPELYDLSVDPGEHRNLVDGEPQRAAAMRATLEGMRGGQPAPQLQSLPAEVEQRLRSLGYIGRAPAELSEGQLADPKDKVALFRDLTKAQGLTRQGEAAAAAELLEKIVAEDPRIVDAQLTLGNARFALADFDGAAQAYRAALELSPDYELALANLAMTHRRLGNRRAAGEEFEALLAIDPRNPAAHFNLGDMALQAGDAAAALRHCEAGIEANDSMPALHFFLGIAALRSGKLERAERAFSRTATLDPEQPRLAYYRAQVAEARNDEEA
ncbi:MAG: sulfatase-like hydrolase/transferase, partial [Acidobacteriota bacterium]